MANLLAGSAAFYPDAELFYPGAVDEATRDRCEALVNDLLSALKATLSNASRLNSEEQDRLGSYLGEIMRILDIDNSNELINVWRYGFPYGWFRSSELKARGDFTAAATPPRHGLVVATQGQ